MAKIIKKHSALEQTYRRQRTRTLRLLLMSAVGVFGIIAGMYLLLPVVLGVGFLWIFVCLLLALLPTRDLNSLRTGIDGENAAARLLQKLPDSYRCYQNVVVSYQGKTSEMDLVAVGPTGVFIIEVKNLNGHLTGAFEDPYWIQHKVGRRGGAYEKQLYSPIKQVGTHIYRLAHYLRQRGCRAHIDGMVLFTNPDATVTLQGAPGDIPVFSGPDASKQLLRHITAGTAALSSRTQKEIFRLLQEV